MYHKCLILILFTSLICKNLTNAADKRCFNPPLFNVEVEKFEGKWYPQQISNDEESKKSCLYYNLTSDKKKSNGTMYFKRWGKDSDQFRIFQKGSTTEFDMEWQGSNRTMWVLSTDYDSFVVWYVCYPEDHSKSTLGLSTREANPDKASFEKLEDVTKGVVNLKIIKKLLKKINRSNCK